MRTLATILLAVAGAMAFDDWFDGWWWSFIGAGMGILAFRLWERFAGQADKWGHRRRMEARHRRNNGLGGLTPATVRDIDSLVHRDLDEDDLIEETLAAVHDDDSVFTIKLAPCMPEHYPDAENCDVWVNTTGDTPHAYIRHEEEGEEPLWNSMRTSTDGGIILINGDLMVSLVVVESKVLVHTIKDLMKCTHRSELELETIRHLDSVGESKAHALCIASGFDPEKLMPTPRDEANTGKRVIDLGK